MLPARRQMTPASDAVPLEHLRDIYARVLNTATHDTAVTAAVRAAGRYSRVLTRLDAHPLALASHDDRLTASPGLWITVHLGTPTRLPAALDCIDAASGAPLDFVDGIASEAEPARAFDLFGVPCAMPVTATQPEVTVGVAGLVLRPDQRSLHLMTDGPWHWTSDKDHVVAALQRMVREHLPQWQPPVPG